MRFITEGNIKEFVFLAADVEDIMSASYIFFDDEGNEGMLGHFDPCSDPNITLLNDIYNDAHRRAAYLYSGKELLELTEPLHHKVIMLFKKGTGEFGSTQYAAAESVSDKFLLELFAEAVRNKMDIYDNKIRMNALLDKNGSDKLGGIFFGERGVERYDLDGEREFDYICARSASYDRYKTEVL